MRCAAGAAGRKAEGLNAVSVPADATYKDHFSDRSGLYARYRPSYPDALFEHLASLCGSRACAWDCATGNGQAALALADHFDRVVASDASEQQIAAAVPADKVEYRTVAAESSGLRDDSIDLITVGQAVHWFDRARFFDEARRVLVDGGVIAVWCYELCNVSDACDAIVDELYDDIVGDFWPPERRHIEDGYAAIELPGAPLDMPAFDMRVEWSAAEMLGYLRTWSACKRYERHHGDDPVAGIAAALESAWGPVPRTVAWPLCVRASRV